MNIRNTIVTLLAFACMTDAHAQKKSERQKKQRTRIGIEAELGVAQTTYKGFPYQPDIAKIKGVGSFSGGVFVDIPIVKHWSIRPELIYSQLGFQRYVEGDQGIDAYKRRINYFETPLSVKFTTGKFSVSGGAKVGFLNRASMTINEGVATSYTDEAYLYRKILWSALVGAEYNFSRHFGLQLRYSFALNDIADHSANDGYPVTEKLYPNAFRFGIHHKF